MNEIRPWENLGMTIAQGQNVLRQANLDWRVGFLPQMVEVSKGHYVRTGKYAYMGPNNIILSSDALSNQTPMQNSEGLQLFAKYLAESGSHIVAAGTLRENKLVWYLAETGHKTGNITGHVLFSLYHAPQVQPDVRFMPIMTNTFTALSTELIGVYTDEVLDIMPGMIETFVTNGMQKWRNARELLREKQCTTKDFEFVVQKVFPLSGVGKSKWSVSIPAQRIISGYSKAPEHTNWWGGYCAICHGIDYSLGHKASTRLDSAWYGIYQSRKELALSKILEHVKVHPRELTP